MPLRTRQKESLGVLKSLWTTAWVEWWDWVVGPRRHSGRSWRKTPIQMSLDFASYSNQRTYNGCEYMLSHISLTRHPLTNLLFWSIIRHCPFGHLEVKAEWRPAGSFPKVRWKISEHYLLHGVIVDHTTPLTGTPFAYPVSKLVAILTYASYQCDVFFY